MEILEVVLFPDVFESRLFHVCKILHRLCTKHPTCLYHNFRRHIKSEYDNITESSEIILWQ
jgi:hypothetical protein